MKKDKVTKRPAVLQVNKLYYPFIGGIENIVRIVSEGLIDKMKVDVFVCNEKHVTKKEIINGVSVFKASSLFRLGNLPLSLSMFHDFKKISKDYDIIQFHMPFPPGDLACLLSGYRGKVVVWWHSDVIRQKKMMLFYRPIMERFLKRADNIIVASDENIQYSKYLPKYRQKCVVIPYGIQPEVMKASNLYIANSVPGKELENEEVHFLFVGRLVYYKGCDTLLKAFQKVLLSVGRAHLTLVGKGVLEHEMIDLLNELKIQDHVTVLGQVSEEKLMEEYEHCDVFVLPSVARSEAFGLVQIEAMAFGKPVINTSLKSGVPTVSVNKKTGLTVAPGNIEELCQAMKWMIEHREDRILMGIEARKRVEQTYSTESMLRKVSHLYETLTPEGK